MKRILLKSRLQIVIAFALLAANAAQAGINASPAENGQQMTRLLRPLALGESGRAVAGIVSSSIAGLAADTAATDRTVSLIGYLTYLLTQAHPRPGASADRLNADSYQKTFKLMAALIYNDQNILRDPRPLQKIDLIHILDNIERVTGVAPNYAVLKGMVNAAGVSDEYERALQRFFVGMRRRGTISPSAHGQEELPRLLEELRSGIMTDNGDLAVNLLEDALKRAQKLRDDLMLGRHPDTTVISDIHGRHRPVERVRDLSATGGPVTEVISLGDELSLIHI